MNRPPPQAYLLRLWREYQGAPLRVTLIPVGTPEAQQHFSSLEECFAFLHTQTSMPGETSDGETYQLYVRE